jgi:hypothetical protein
MKTGIPWGVALVLCAAAEATEPPAQAPKSVAAARPGASAAQHKPEIPATPLKLHVGDVRKYMMPNEFREAVGAPDADKTTVIVQGERQAPPLQSVQPLPQGLPAIVSLFTHPTRAWRLLLPDPNGIPAGPPDVVPKPEFRWGP